MAASSNFIATTRSLAVDLVSREVGLAFDQAGVAYVLLKGPSIALWLYPGGRRYLDTDLLVPPGSWDGAERTLERLGFINPLADAAIAELDADATMWWREHDGASLDLHRRLRGTGAPAEQVWQILSEQRDAIPIAGRPTPVLNPPARALTLALQAAHDGVGNGQALEDLRRAIRQVSLITWIAALDLATQLEARPAMAMGLRLAPGGPGLADALGLPSVASVTWRLMSAPRPPLAMGFAALADIAGTGAKLGFLRQNLVPSRAFLRSWSRLAHRGTAGLALAYLWRVVYCLWNGPSGYLAWRRARQRARPLP